MDPYEQSDFGTRIEFMFLAGVILRVTEIDNDLGEFILRIVF